MAETSEIEDAVGLIKPILAGRAPEVQAAVLADLVAIWIAGHVAGDADATLRHRAELLGLHTALVTELVPVNARIMTRDGAQVVVTR